MNNALVVHEQYDPSVGEAWLTNHADPDWRLEMELWSNQQDIPADRTLSNTPTCVKEIFVRWIDKRRPTSHMLFCISTRIKRLMEGAHQLFPVSFMYKVITKEDAFGNFGRL